MQVRIGEKKVKIFTWCELGQISLTGHACAFSMSTLIPKCQHECFHHSSNITPKAPCIYFTHSQTHTLSLSLCSLPPIHSAPAAHTASRGRPCTQCRWRADSAAPHCPTHDARWSANAGDCERGRASAERCIRAARPAPRWHCAQNPTPAGASGRV